MARSSEIVSGGAAPTSPLRGRGLVVGGAAVVAVLLALAAASFACSPAVGSSSVTPVAGGPGSDVLVRGWGYSGPVEIRWGSETGPLLARATPSNSTISQSVTIPASDPGFYYIVVTSVDPITSSPITSASTFKVTGSATTPEQPVTEPSPATDPVPAPSTAVPAATSAPAATQSSAPSAAATSAPASPAAQATPASSAQQASAARPGSVTKTVAVAPRRLAGSSPSEAAPQAASQAIATEPVPVPVPAAAAGPADSPAVAAAPQPWAAPVQSHGLFDAAAPDSRPLGAGIVFLALGIAASLAFAAVVGKRRLVRARSQAES